MPKPNAVVARARARNEVMINKKTFDGMNLVPMESNKFKKSGLRLKESPTVRLSDNLMMHTESRNQNMLGGSKTSSTVNLKNDSASDDFSESLEHMLSTIDNSFYSSLLDETVYKGVREKGEVLSSAKWKVSKGDRSSPQKNNSDNDNNGENFYTRAGRAAKSLQEDFPMVFKQAPRMDIYSEDVAFVDDVTVPGSAKVTHGLEAYQRQLWSLRLHSYLFCSSIKMQVLRIWQPQDDKTIHVRWSIKATPRIIGTIIEKPYYIDGLSEFRFNDEGYINMHKITRVDWDRSMFALRNIQKSLNVINVSTNNGGPMMPC